MTKAPTVSLTLRLLRENIAADKVLKEGHDLVEVPSTSGTLFIGQNPPAPPNWTKFLSHYAPEVAVNLRTQSCSAVLIIAAGSSDEKRSFALCFGQGHHALDEDAVVRSFGLRVVLNSVTRGQLRTLDSASLDSTVMQRRMQASRDSDLSAFDLDEYRNLLRLASGTPKGGDFAKAITGKDALHLRAAIAPEKLGEHCAKALELYKATDYQKDFAFIDYVRPVGDRSLNDELDGLAFAELQAMVGGKSSDLHLAIPDILSPDANVELGYFGKGLSSGSKTAYPELAIEDYVLELCKGDFSQIADMAELKGSHEVRLIVDGEGDRRHKRKLYWCFVHEVTLRGDIFVLFDGQWFRINRDYHNEIETAYKALLKPAFRVATTAENEQAFIAELEPEPDMLSLDQTKVSPRGASGASLEPCDFLTRTKQLIHLKDGHSSAPLSHLWNQGLVSAEAFVSDEMFRKGFRNQAKKREAKLGKTGFYGLLPTGRSKPAPSEYTVVFGVMRHPYVASGELGLPFFSKVALRAVAERIGRMGFPVELHLVEKR